MAQDSLFLEDYRNGATVAAGMLGQTLSDLDGPSPVRGQVSLQVVQLWTDGKSLSNGTSGLRRGFDGGWKVKRLERIRGRPPPGQIVGVMSRLQPCTAADPAHPFWDRGALAFTTKSRPPGFSEPRGTRGDSGF